MKNHILDIWYKYVGSIFRILPIKNNRIVFQNFFGKGYGDNPKYIADELLKSKENLEMIWLVKGKYYNEIPKEIKQIKRGTLKELYYLATSKVWVDNCRKHYGIKKRKNQFYLHTWHGTVGLKKMEKDCEDILKKDYVKAAKADSKMIDLIPSGSKLFTSIIKSSFWYDGEIYECGTPRCDIFFKYKKQKRNYKTILYAPTFRDNGDTSIYNLDYNKIIDTLEKKTNEKWKLIVRFHPNVSYLQETINYNNKIIDGSKYDDMNKLIVDSDILITDYSSSMYDALLIKRSVFLYTPDLDKYIGARGSYVDIKKLPYPVSKTEKELIKNFESFNEEKYLKKVDEYIKEVGIIEDGKSSKRLADRILEVIKNDRHNNSSI